MPSMTIDQILSLAKLAQRRVDVVLDRAAAEALVAAQAALKRPTQAVVKKLQLAADEATATFTLQALGFTAWNDLREQNPPRDDVPTDLPLGVNTRTFSRLLMTAPSSAGGDP